MAFALLRTTFLLAFFASVLCHAQEPVELSACDLVTQPQKYNNKVVKLRAQVSIAFEDFTLETPDCGEKLRPIWLAYGGDEPTPTTSTVNDQDRKPGSMPKLNGRPVPLLRDASLELFKNRLGAMRLGGIATTECADRECYLYDVTATLTGVFAAAPDRALGGYGHLGCCHLLMIKQVSDVDAKRTAVPAGGSFTCSTDTWNMTAAEAELRAKRRPCQSRSDCRTAMGEQLQEVARHWNEEISLLQGTIDGMYTGLPTWRSPDLLKSYSLRFQYTDKGKREITGATASRTWCTAADAPFPIGTPIACRRLWYDSPGSKDEVAESGSEEWRFAGPDVASRRVLQELSKQWNVDLLPTLKLRECSTFAVDKKGQGVGCEWIDSTSMQAFYVSMRRGKSSKDPWALWHANGVSCTAETTELDSSSNLSPRL